MIKIVYQSHVSEWAFLQKVAENAVFQVHQAVVEVDHPDYVLVLEVWDLQELDVIEMIAVGLRLGLGVGFLVVCFNY